MISFGLILLWLFTFGHNCNLRYSLLFHFEYTARRNARRGAGVRAQDLTNGLQLATRSNVLRAHGTLVHIIIRERMGKLDINK